MTGHLVRRTCDHPTLSSRRCRRTARWGFRRGGTEVLCWQHAVEVARNRGLTELIHWISGTRRRVPASPTAPPSCPDRPLPTGRAAIVRELNRARNRRALARARYALISDLRSCLDRRGLDATVRDALRTAHARVGIPFGGTR